MNIVILRWWCGNTLPHQKKKKFQLLTLKGTVDLNYMNTNVVYIFFFSFFFPKHKLIDAKYILVSYEKNVQHIVPKTQETSSYQLMWFLRVTKAKM